PGFRAATAGPFEGDAPPPEVELALERGPSIAGRVSRAGEAVAGAAVHLRRAEPEGAARLPQHWFGIGAPFELHTTPVSWRGQGVRATTDGGGRFVWPIEPIAAAPRDARWYVHVAADGCASALEGPLTIEPSEGVADLHVMLGAGGAVEIRVQLPAELEPAGS